MIVMVQDLTVTAYFLIQVNMGHNINTILNNVTFKTAQCSSQVNIYDHTNVNYTTLCKHYL
jgi:hypothetical protein